MSIHFSMHASPILMAVSLMVCSAVATCFPVPEIKASISCSVGMNGIFSVIV